MLDINMHTPSSIMEELKSHFTQKRLSLNLAQQGLSKKSGVSLGSLKRFEHSGQISLESLLKLAVVLDCLDDFRDIAQSPKQELKSIDELLKQDKPIKKRGSIK